MNTTHKRNSSRSRLAARGITAVCGCAVLLLSGVMMARQIAPEEPAGDSVSISAAEPTEVTLPPNPYGPEDFTYDKQGYLTCTAGPSLPGVDVSAHQQQIDWPQVAESGIKFAMVRLGYRGTTEGGIYPDEFASANLDGARGAGLAIGAYFFSQAVTPEEAEAEAAMCLELLEGRSLELPVVFDWEYTGDDTRTAGLSPEVLMECAKVFCEAIRAGGYEPMLYFNPHLSRTMLDLTQLSDYPFWLAMYQDEMDYPHAVRMWQYTANGSVPGISGDADLNLLFTD